MFNKTLLFFLAGMILSGVVSAEGFRRITEEGAVDLKSVLGKMIEVRSEAGIASLVRSGDMATLKVERVADRLFITPLSRVPAELVVVDVSGRSYHLRFVTGNEGEGGVVLGAGKDPEDGAVRLGAWSRDFLRALVKGKVPAGTTEEKVGQIVFDNGRMQVELLKRYVSSGCVGYVLDVRNISAQALVVPVEHIVFPRLLAVSAQRDVIEAAGKKNDHTKMFLIAGK